MQRPVLGRVNTFLVLLILVGVSQQRLIVVAGQSMAPNVVPGQRLVADKLLLQIDDPSRGDIVIVKPLGSRKETVVKRVVGLPGEVIEVRAGYVFINGQLLDEPYHPHPGGSSYPPTLIPPDHYFLLGDNRATSTDSRSFGCVHKDSLAGRVWLVEQ